MSSEQSQMREESRQIRAIQREVQDILHSRSEILSQSKRAKMLNKIRMGGLKQEDLDLDTCLELAESFGQIKSVLGLEESDFTKQLEQQAQVIRQILLGRVSHEIDSSRLEYFRRISEYFLREHRMETLFKLFDRKCLRFDLAQLTVSISDTANNTKALRMCLEDLVLILETSAVQRQDSGGILPERNGQQLPTGLVRVLAEWDRQTMEVYLEHFFSANVKSFLAKVLESSNVKNDRSQQHFFVVNLKNFHEVFAEFDSSVEQSLSLDSIEKEKCAELRKRVSEDYYEGYFAVEQLYVKNTGLIYTKLMKQNLERELEKIAQVWEKLGEDGFVLEQTSPAFEQRFAKR